jgi:mRNA interferase MazF
VERSPLNRGGLVKAVLAGDFGKPRPVLVVQSDAFADLPTLLVCPLTSDETGAGPTRVRLDATPANGLRSPSLIMVEKVTAVARTRIREQIGSIGADELRSVDAVLAAILGYSDPA